jgi:RHS repeat-associated protein
MTKRLPHTKFLQPKTTPSASRKTIVLFAMAATGIVAIGIAALATNPLVTAPLEESAVDRANDFGKKHPPRAYANLVGNSLHPAVQLANTAAKQTGEPMPPLARPATNRAEAEKIIAQGSGSNSQFVYDPYDRVVQITDPGNVVRQFVWSGTTLCEERDGSGNVTKQFFNWGEIIGGTKYFYTRDYLGSVREMTDQSGNVVAAYSYDPFGKVTKISGSGPDSDFLYAGYFYHKPSGLYITSHRLYSPKLGRWLNRDPIDDPTLALTPQNPEGEAAPENESAAGAPLNPNFLTFQNAPKSPIQMQVAKHAPHVPNLYTYANNNPINKVDPSGLQATDLGPTPCPQCTNDCDVHPANCHLYQRWSKQQQQYLYTIGFQQPGTPSKPGKTCTAYGYNGWPDTNGYCTWQCN